MSKLSQVIALGVDTTKDTISDQDLVKMTSKQDQAFVIESLSELNGVADKIADLSLNQQCSLASKAAPC